jgi:DNA-binding LacI/PurR family transcriptional regulator
MRNTDYRAIYNQLRQQILSGQYRAGEKLPTEMELAKRFAVSRATGAAALKALEQDGLVQRAPRRGTIVNRHPPVNQPGTRPLLAWIQPESDLFAIELLRGCEHATQQAGYNLLFQLTGPALSEEVAIHNALMAGVRGLALYPQDGETYNVEVLRLVIDKFPLVLLDRYLRGIDCAAVYCDHLGGARSLVEELVRAGHRHICAMVYPPKGTSSIEDRLEGYTQALTAAGIPLDMSLIYVEDQHCKHLYTRHAPDSNGDADRSADVVRFAQYLRSKPEITAIFATNEPLNSSRFIDRKL